MISARDAFAAAFCLVAACANSPSLPPGESADELASACPASRNDAVCSCLRAPTASCFPVLVQAVRQQLTPPDAAVTYFIRQRLVSLLAHDDAELHDYFPSYPTDYFPLAHLGIAPPASNGCASAPEVVLLFPGVIRTLGRNEFVQQIAAMQQRFPGALFQVVDSDTFSEPPVIAGAARSLIEERYPSPMPIHLLGYSQGAQSALWLLATTPSLSSRVKSVVLMNSAAQGSEVANLLIRPLSLFAVEGESCQALPSWAVALCRRLAGYTLSASTRKFLEEAAKPLGISLPVAPGSTAGDFFLARIAGLQSLTTDYAAGFWSRYGAQLPRTPTYLLFRSQIADTRDLPDSNWFFYHWLRSVDRDRPENDMQVRLVNQGLGPPLDGLQILSPVAEGNHWQWELVPHDVPNPVMPEAMAARMPQVTLFLALYETLNEAGRYCSP